MAQRVHISWMLNKDHVCTFKNTSWQVYDMAFDNMLAIWPSFITFVQHFVDCLFPSIILKQTRCRSLTFSVSQTLSFSPSLHVKKHKHYINGTQLCATDPRVSDFLSNEPLRLVSFHSLAEYVQTSEISWWRDSLNFRIKTLGPRQHENYHTTKSRSDRTDFFF